jgi:3-oxoacyl-[acyl-carrier-protein] synthase II
MNTRIAITGMGAVTPLGNNVETTWEGLIHGRSGIGPITRFNASDFPCRIGGEIRDLPEVKGVPEKLRRRFDPFTAYALSACAEAYSQAGLDRPEWDRARAGVVIGSSRGGVTTLESNWNAFNRKGYHALSPTVTASSLLSQAPAMISQQYGILGPSFAVSTACASGAHAIGEAVRLIRSGDADVMITGGSEAPITPLIVGGFAKARALSRRNHEPAKACRPFDRDRDGFVISEGAGILVLEKWEYAKGRGAKILGEIPGFGMSSDAYHMTAPHPRGDGMERAMRLAMKDAGLGPDEIGLVNSHGTGTGLNDRIEALAANNALGPRAQQIPVCAIKSMTGHMLGASGALEVIASVMMIRHGIAPSILNLDHPDPECRLNLVRGEAQHVKCTAILTSSFAFGGANAALIVRGH